MTKKIDLMDGAEIASIGASFVLLIMKEVTYAAVPLTLALGLGMANRLKNYQKSAEELHQYNDHLVTLQHNVDKQKIVVNKVEPLTQESKQHQESIDRANSGIKELQQLLAALEEKTQHMEQNINSIEVKDQRLEVIVEDLKEIQNYSQAIRVNPQSGEFYYQRGISYQHLGDKQGAYEDYSEAIKLDPSYAQAYHHRGLLSAELGNKKRAVEDLRKAAKLYFDQGDIDNYQRTRDLSKEFYEMGNASAKSDDNNHSGGYLMIDGVFN